jgi:uncharacterized protein (TIGR02594 family)
MVTRTDDAPDWLLVMRAITGLTETPGEEDNPKILAMRNFIAHKFPEQSDYCDLYVHDDTPWCGLTAAFCMAVANIRGPFGPEDTDRWMWALSWANDENFIILDAPRLGCVVVLEREGGGHVTFYESTDGDSYMCRGGNQSDMVNLAPQKISNVVALVWPVAGGPVPPAERRELEEGDTGADVEALQESLGLLGENADGDFGNTTDTQVKAFQRACDLSPDGVVGSMTWAEVDALDARMAAGSTGLSPTLTQAVTQLAEDSSMMDYSWSDRGRAPPGYIPGMALCFALAVSRLRDKDSAVEVMAQANTGDDDVDALSWYSEEFEGAGMDNSSDGVDTLRHLFVLLTGLGMRESSGRYCEGRDMSASNVEADTCEAGLFQTSWNIRTASPEMPALFEEYWDNPQGFLEVFSENINPTAGNLDVYGSGDGAAYQWLAKFCPAFAVMTTAVGLRTRRQHWGPINRVECELVEALDDLLKEVQDMVESEPPPGPGPGPEPEVAEVVLTIETVGAVNVTVRGS